MEHTASSVFDLMDRWRHLPNYQLERRADLFFALYLPEVLEQQLGTGFRASVIPEFPLRIGTIYPHIEIDKSFKLDYLALASGMDKAVFVELKTDGSSRRDKQDKYLDAACEKGLPALAEGVVQIFRASFAKRKYYRLLTLMEELQLIEIPAEFHRIMGRPTLQGIIEASHDIRITCPEMECQVIYIQPGAIEPREIGFEEFAGIVSRHGDPISQRFAESLLKWKSCPAGAEQEE